MTKTQAEQYVRDHDDETADPAELPAVFAALYDREPDAQDDAEGLWSHCCAAVSPDHVTLRDRLSGETWTDPAPTDANVRAHIAAGLNDGETVAYEVEGDDGSFFEGEATG